MRYFAITWAGFLAITFTGCAGIPRVQPPIRTSTVEGTPPQDSQRQTKERISSHRDISKPVVETVAYELELESNSIPLQSDDANADALRTHPVCFVKPVVEPSLGVPQTASPALQEFNIGGLPQDSGYTLTDLEQLALCNNPSIAAAGATSSKAVGLWNQVGARPNPTFGYFGQQLADQNTDQHGLFFEQEFVRGDKLRLNQAVLSHTTNAQRWEIETQRQRVLTDVRVRFFEALAAQRQLDATHNFMQVAQRGVEVAEQRKEAEEGNLIEVLQSQTLLSEITLAAEQSEAAYAGAWKSLAAIAGIADSAPVRLVAEFETPEFVPDWDSVYADIIARSPELSVARALVCEKAALIRRQKAQPIPNLTGQFGAGYDNGTGSGMINLQVSAPIPVWNKNEGNISAACADYARATQNVRRIEQEIKSRLARAAQELNASLATVSKYEQEIIPQSRQGLELSEQAYQAGELDFLQVLVLRRSLYESMIRFIAAQGQLAQATAKIDGLVLTGGLDAPRDFTDGDGIRGASFGGQ